MSKKYNYYRCLLLLFLLLILQNCEDKINNIDNKITERYLDSIIIPFGFPDLLYPEDNQFNKHRWLLGKKLFYEKRLSRDSSVSCASCHKLENAFSDDKRFSLGIENRIGISNASTLTNIGFSPYLNRDGGVKTLEMQSLVPIQEHLEFDFNIIEIANRLSKISIYNELSLLAYNRNLDYFVIPRALSTFERSLISSNSLYDLSLINKYTFSKSEKNGKELFFSERLKCNNCHSGINFTNYTFENNGLYLEYENKGRFRITQNIPDLSKFKVPTLRNLSYTNPYMHDGSLNTLEDVINHYNSGGKNHINKNNMIQILNLTEIEKRDLILFLRTLDDNIFIKNSLFKE